MNLIEQLGGYEKAKTVLDKAPCKTYTYHNHPYQKGYIRCWGGDGKEYFLVSDIEQALLEYRRQHNIFEVGDRVVILTMHLDNKFVHVVSKVLEDLVEVCGSYVYSSELRHATPEEIATGKKLEVS